MNDSSNIWLAIIALSTPRDGHRAGRCDRRRRHRRPARPGAPGRVEQQLQHKIEPFVDQVQPLVERLNVISADATRLSALAVQQAEKADVAFTSAAQRVDQTLAVVQNAVVAPAREGMALASAIRAAVGSIRKGRTSRRRAIRERRGRRALHRLTYGSVARHAPSLGGLRSMNQWGSRVTQRFSSQGSRRRSPRVSPAGGIEYGGTGQGTGRAVGGQG